jgi:hypothetical protein
MKKSNAKTIVLALACISILIVNSFNSNAQNTPFNILLEPLAIQKVGGIQSYAFAQYNGKWLIIGGRLDGLHQRQPFASFDSDGNNTQIIVIDPISKMKWSASLKQLPVSLQEQLSATNMQFYQNEKYLYVLGGYGYSSTLDDHTTYSNLTAINVPATIDAIITNTPFTTNFRQITDSLFQITGGRLGKINNTFYLVGGQRFIGRYNPMGPDHGPGFTQEYSNKIIKFNIIDNDTTLVIQHLAIIKDSVNLHRRDYNVVPQIMPNGQEGLTAFSGVFQTNHNLPFLNCVNIDSESSSVNNNFTQYYNHYHCATFPIYSAKSNEMNCIFFGGIAQYYDDNGMLTQDNNVPFTKTIARVSRDANGKMAEYKLPNNMPNFLGAGSEFFVIETLPKYPNGVLKFDELNNDTTAIGYIYGGISSKESNIFWENDGTQSTASSQIFKVLLIKNNNKTTHKLNVQSNGTLKVDAYPNLDENKITIKYNLTKTTDVKILLYTLQGKKIINTIIKNQSIGNNIFEKKNSLFSKKGEYILSIETAYEKATQKIIINP